MSVKKLKSQFQQSETNGDHLVNAMKTVAHSQQAIDTVQSKVTTIEKQIKESGLGMLNYLPTSSVTVHVL